MINPFIILLVGSALPKFYAKYKHFTIPYQVSVGKLTWLIDLEPNTSTTKNFTYTVKYPVNERVIGL